MFHEKLRSLFPMDKLREFREFMEGGYGGNSGNKKITQRYIHMHFIMRNKIHFGLRFDFYFHF